MRLVAQGRRNSADEKRNRGIPAAVTAVAAQFPSRRWSNVPSPSWNIAALSEGSRAPAIATLFAPLMALIGVCGVDSIVETNPTNSGIESKTP